MGFGRNTNHMTTLKKMKTHKTLCVTHRHGVRAVQTLAKWPFAGTVKTHRIRRKGKTRIRQAGSAWALVDSLPLAESRKNGFGLGEPYQADEQQPTVFRAWKSETGIPENSQATPADRDCSVRVHDTTEVQSLATAQGNEKGEALCSASPRLPLRAIHLRLAGLRSVCHEALRSTTRPELYSPTVESP